MQKLKVICKLKYLDEKSILFDEMSLAWISRDTHITSFYSILPTQCQKQMTLLRPVKPSLETCCEKFVTTAKVKAFHALILKVSEGIS